MGKIEWSNHPRNQRHFWELWMLICCTSFAMRVQKWDISAVKSTMFFSKPFSQRTACLLDPARHWSNVPVMTRSHYLLTVSSTIWIHLMVMFQRNQAQLLEFERWHMDGFRSQSLVSFVSTIALWCDFSWKMPLKLKKKSPRKLATMSPNEFLWEVHDFRPKVITCHAAGLPLLLLGCPLDQLGSHVGMCCSWFHQMIVTKCQPLHIFKVDCIILYVWLV